MYSDLNQLMKSMQLPKSWEAFSASLHVQVPHNGGQLQKSLIENPVGCLTIIIITTLIYD